MPSIIRSSRGYGKNKSSSVTDVYAKNTTLLLKGDQPSAPFLNDASTKSSEITTFGYPRPSSFHPFNEGQYSYEFQSASDYFTLPTVTSLYTFPANVDFTMEAWVYPTAMVGNSWGIIDARASGGTSAAWVFHLVPSGNTYKLEFFNAGANTGSTLIQLNRWTHVAIVRSGSFIRLYVNGVLDLTLSGASAAIDPGATGPWIGPIKDASAGTYLTVGNISNLRIVKGTAVYTADFVPPTSPLTPIPGTILLTCQSSTQIDRSIYNQTLSTTGYSTVKHISPFEKNVVLKYDPPSYSGYFTGTKHTTPSNTLYNIGTGDFTVEFWFKYTSSLQYATVFNLGTYITGIMVRWNYQNYDIYTVNGQLSISGTIPLNTWTHFAMVRSNGTLNIYIDGVSIYSGANVVDISPGAGLTIGGSAHTSGETYTGYISNLRFINNSAVYTAAFTPPTSPLTAIPGTKFLGCQSSTFIDNSSVAAPITVSTGKGVIYQESPFVKPTYASLTGNEGSLWLDVVTDRLKVNPEQLSDFAFFLNDFTVELWAYCQEPAEKYLFCLAGSFQVYIDDNNVVYYYGASPLITGNAVRIGQWNHIAISRISGSTKLFLNGIIQGSAYADTNNWGVPTQVLIAQEQSNAGTYGAKRAYISNLRVVNGTGVYSSNFVPPTTPLSAIPNTVLLTLQNNTANENKTFIDDSLTTGNINTFGNVTKNLVNPFGHNWSYYFDGASSDYITVPHSPALDLSTTAPDFTIDLWFYPTYFNPNGYELVNKDGVSGTSYSSYGISVTSSGYLQGYTGTGDGASGGKGIATVGGTYKVPNNQWTHVALVRAGGAIIFFVNGVLNGYAAQSGYTMIDGGKSLLIGWQQGQTSYFYGYISNLRIINGAALFQDNFTPPTRVSIASPAPTVYYPESNGVYFPGSARVDYIPSVITTGEFTVEAWVRPTVLNSLNTIFSNFRWQTGQNSGWRMIINSSGLMEWRASTGTYNSEPILYKSTTPLQINKWSHIAVTRDAADTMRVFINGNYANAEITYSSSFNLSSDGSYTTLGRLGGSIADGTSYDTWNGHISGVRIVTGATGACLYSNTFIPQYPLSLVNNTTLLIAQSNTYVNLANTASFGIVGTGSPVIANTRPSIAVANTRPSLLTAVSNKVEDISVNRIPLTKNNKAKLTKFSPFDTSVVTPKSYSVALERQNQYINIANRDWTRFYGQFTFEGWFYWNYPIVPGSVIGVQSSNGLTLYYDGNGLMPNLYGSGNLVTTAFKPQVGVWYHIAVTRDGNNLMTMWVNGENVGSGTVSNVFTKGTYTIGPLASSGDQLRGYVSNFRVVIDRSLYTSNFTVPTAPLEAVQGTVLLTCQSPTFRDNSVTNAPLQVIGNPDPKITEFNPYSYNYNILPAGYSSNVFGASAYFDGNGDYIAVTDIGGLRLSNIFTIQGWFNPTSQVAGNVTIVSKGAVATGWQLMMGTGNVLHFSNATQVLSTATPIKFNEWTHFAVVRNIGDRTMVFVNGNLEVTGTITNPFTETADLRIGSGRVAGANVFTGYISDLRLDRFAYYSNNFVPSYAPITHTKDSVFIQDKRVAIRDYTMLNSIEKTSNTSLRTISPSVTDGYYSNYFDGTGDYLTTPSSTSFAFGTGDFTIEMWVYPTSASSTRLLEFGGNADNLDFNITSTGTISYYNGSTSATSAGGLVNVGQWAHVAVSRVSGTVTVYVNGVVAVTQSTPSNYTTARIVYIGGVTNGLFAGYISNLRVVKGRAVYTSNFTPSIIPLTANQIAETVLLTCQSNRFIDNKNNFAITKAGEVSVVNRNPFTNPPIVPTSLFFDGTGTGKIVLPAYSQAFWFGLNDFTVEFWMYPMTASTAEWEIVESQTTNAFCIYNRAAAADFAFRGYGNTDVRILTSAQMVAYSNSWIHVAISRANNYTRAYVNGSITANVLDLTNYISPSTVTTIGDRITGGDAFAGYLSDFRVTKGIARYTANTIGAFNPPASLPYKGTVTATSLPLQYDVLLVAGGGAGGYAYGGGGGAGGLIATNVNILPGVQYSIIVGGGGATSTAPSTTGTYNGSNTNAFGLTAVGGGQGGPDTGKLPSPGGSGGGVALNTYLNYGYAASQGNAYPGQGFAGGIDIFNDSVARSGGGAGGSAGVTSGAAGGVGYKWLDGVYYAGGGGGMHPTTKTPGGLGGGGYGAVASTVGGAGAVNTGGGGGGGAQTPAGGSAVYGQAGGSGIVIIRYPKKYNLADYIVGSVDVSEIGDYRYYTFKQSANIIFNNPYNPNISNLLVSYTIVGSGGGGGTGWGGGGGGGGVLNGNSFLLPNVEYVVTLGAGGAGAPGYNIHGLNGANTILSSNSLGFSLIAYGGGGGGSWDGSASYPNGGALYVGYHGGSGGGAASKGASAGNVWVSGQGQPGGRGQSDNSSYDGAGGGGGAAGAGQIGSSTGGRGGFALVSPINGLYYGAGGGGGSTGTGGAGGFGNGPGNGGTGGGANSANTYSGGGGGGGQPTGAGGSGASGTVILSHPLSYEAATGSGFTTTYSSSGVIYSFTSSGTLRLTAAQTKILNYLVVAGGGGGGFNAGSGAGAGGLAYSSTAIVPGTYTITVGAGGAASPASDAAAGTNGSPSSFVGGTANIQMIGGGAGGSGGTAGVAGGSGGGTPGGDSGAPAGALGTAGQGYPGGAGSGSASTRAAGGGGGASAAGGSGSAGTIGGVGGAGLSTSISGVTIAYAGGGGAGVHGGPGGAGGLGGGGTGGNSPGGAATPGVINTGGGGGGGAGYSGAGGTGAPGVVVLSTPAAVTATTSGANVVVTTSGGNKIYKFYSSGTITF